MSDYLLTNHAYVLACMARDPKILMREVASELDITERAVQRIVAELEVAGFLTRKRVGRCNEYEVDDVRALAGVGALLEALPRVVLAPDVSVTA